MANDTNHVCLIGRLTRDPELKFTPNNTPIASFSLANNKSYTANGEKKEQVGFFNCICWGKGGQILAQYCKKGNRLLIEGRLQQRSWDDKDGNKRSMVEIVVEKFQFLESAKREDGAQKEPEWPPPSFDDCEPAGSFSDADMPF